MFFKILFLLKILKFINWINVSGKKKKYPKVIQLPLTNKCNSKCVMCNVWKMSNSNEMTIDEFAKYMKDPLFKKVNSVGINGGEPSLIPNLEKYAEKILALPSIRSLNIISNGFNKNILKQIRSIYVLSKEKGVHFHVSISLDGYEDVHNKIRRIPNAFKKVTYVIDELHTNKEKYCDSLEVACTVMQQNVDYLIELDTYAKQKNYNMTYRLAVSNKRIGSEKIFSKYSVLAEEKCIQTAKEFFYTKYKQSQRVREKYKYFLIFHYLGFRIPKRLFACPWQDSGVTINARGELFYCAVESKMIGSLRHSIGKNIFFKDENIKYRQELIKNYCDHCIHYVFRPNRKSLLIILNNIFHEKYYPVWYKLKAKFL
ncbi:MAG: radical SAM protein [Spirochaetia bacterium]|nr:radical SAM protein [Spirochaetia bacterium]